MFLTLISLYTSEALTETQKTLSIILSRLKFISKIIQALKKSFVNCCLNKRKRRKRRKLNLRVRTTFFADRTNSRFWDLSIFTTIFCSKI